MSSNRKRFAKQYSREHNVSLSRAYRIYDQRHAVPSWTLGYSDGRKITASFGVMRVIPHLMIVADDRRTSDGVVASMVRQLGDTVQIEDVQSPEQLRAVRDESRRRNTVMSRTVCDETGEPPCEWEAYRQETGSDERDIVAVVRVDGDAIEDYWDDLFALVRTGRASCVFVVIVMEPVAAYALGVQVRMHCARLVLTADNRIYTRLTGTERPYTDDPASVAFWLSEDESCSVNRLVTG